MLIYILAAAVYGRLRPFVLDFMRILYEKDMYDIVIDGFKLISVFLF